MCNNAYDKQLEYQLKIQEAGYNIVCCNNCPCVFLHKTGEDFLICPHCNIEGYICDFGDLYY